MRSLADRGSLRVVMLLSSGPRRFNELTRLIGGISQWMPTLVLRGPTPEGRVTRAEGP